MITGEMIMNEQPENTATAETLPDTPWGWLLGMYALITGMAVSAVMGESAAMWGSFGLLAVTIFSRIGLAAHRGQ